MFTKELSGAFAMFFAGNMTEPCQIHKMLRLPILRSHARRVVGHGEGRALFGIDECIQDCFLKWSMGAFPGPKGGKPAALKTERSLAENWRRKQLRDLGKDLSFKTALCDRPAIGGDKEDSPQAIHCGDDKPQSAKASAAEKEQLPLFTSKPSPTMQENARRLSGRILPKLGGQLLVDAKIDLGEDFRLLDLIRQGYTQTEIAERLNVSQGTISNRSKKLSAYFAT